MATDFDYVPNIPLPENIGLLISRRSGGQSQGPYSSFNVADHVGDDATIVAANRELLLSAMPAAKSIQWLNQTHSCVMVQAGQEQCPNADASFSADIGQACAVLTADCLPVLMWRVDGSAVAAVHAGWRGLANGILLDNFSELNKQGNKSSPWQAYIGPAISQQYFEVGIEVLETFFELAPSADILEATAAASLPSKCNPLKYHLDLAAIAKAQLISLGLTNVHGGDECSFADEQNYFSFRRSSQAGDSRCGRMASLIWRK
ncbi:peptidoglycan editing factor PgeF [uncultured Pseudoteredinibacter sp.]|uniref:peptidoglycan editing factor PgeF n=1 Tax=uncultured Pseudoteredinibacter sp. TaxID=1641701 RepID=UPI002619CFBF|nr:peptidoglycan editing factor PgeF [uncultured Pseudoteredinibacter sp.]